VAAAPLLLDESELTACVACGLCLPHCPTYRVTGLEIASPRGRIAAMQAVQLGGRAIDREFVAAMDACVQCRGCETACPSSVPFGRLMEGAKTAIAPRRSWLRRAVERVALSWVLPRHKLLRATTWVLYAAQRLRVLPRRAGVPLLRARALRLRLHGAAAPSAWLFTGCVMDAWQRDVHADAMRVMQACGAAVGLPGRGGDCCGALHAHAGRERDARALARNVIASMPGDAPIVVDSAGCGAAMREYGALLGTPEARAFSGRVRDFAEWVVQQGVPPMRRSERLVVIQDPCHLRNVQRVERHVRTLLAPAYELRETADDGLCCGAGGAYSVTEPGLSAKMRARKVDAIRAAAGAGRPYVVASPNPGCAMHLGAAGLTTRHPAQLVADVLEDPS
jgi:glycolate oxidase iron-sulfur subunit